MNAPKHWKRWLSIAVVLAVANWFWRGPSRLKPITPDSPAQQYYAEFSSHSFTAADTIKAPDGSAYIVDRSPPVPNLFTFIFHSCHELRYAPRWGLSRKILAARDSDGASGRTFFWGWSKDSKAIFIAGGHSGIDCRGVEMGSFRVIYTIADKTAWELPNGRL